jgi:hypothetical protein
LYICQHFLFVAELIIYHLLEGFGLLAPCGDNDSGAEDIDTGSLSILTQRVFLGTITGSLPGLFTAFACIGENVASAVFSGPACQRGDDTGPDNPSGFIKAI